MLKKEKQRIQNEYEQTDGSVVFGMNLNTSMTYQHDQKRFAMSVFEPGIFIPYGPGPTRGTQYKLNFANGEGLRYIPMELAQAKALTQKFKFHNTSNNVLAMMKFKIIGAGDPTGAVNSQYTLRGEILSVKYVTSRGELIHDPGTVKPYDIKQDPPVISPDKFNIMQLRTGVKVEELQKTIEEEFGKIASVSPTKRDDKRLMRGVGYAPNDCYTFGRKKAKVGNVCIRAFPDKTGIIRKIVVEQIVEGNEYDGIRQALLKKYGAMAESVNKANTQYYGWGPNITKSVTMDDQLAPARALSASLRGIQSSLDRMSASTRVSINLRIRLIDSTWAAQSTENPSQPKKRKGPRL